MNNDPQVCRIEFSPGPRHAHGHTIGDVMASIRALASGLGKLSLVISEINMRLAEVTDTVNQIEKVQDKMNNRRFLDRNQ